MSPQPLKGKRLSDINIKPRLFGIGTVTINARTIAAPLVAFTMATLLFVYTRSSIQAAKRNAKDHRIADGGQISWYNESQRRHGALARANEHGPPVRSAIITAERSNEADEQRAQKSAKEIKLMTKKIGRKTADG